MGCMKVLGGSQHLERASDSVSPCGCVPRRRALLDQLRSRHLVNTVLVNPVGTCGIGGSLLGTPRRIHTCVDSVQQPQQYKINYAG